MADLTRTQERINGLWADVRELIEAEEQARKIQRDLWEWFNGGEYHTASETEFFLSGIDNALGDVRKSCSLVGAELMDICVYESC